MNPKVSEATLEQIKADLRTGQKIAAIKRLREATGLGLAESKTAVENLQAELHAKDPATYPAPQTGGKGCSTVIALLVVIGLFLLGFLLG